MIYGIPSYTHTALRLDAGEIEYASGVYSPFRDMVSKCLVSPRRIAQAFSRAHIRAAERTTK